MRPDIERTIDENFLNVALRPETMPFYTVRKAILDAVSEASRKFHGVVLDVGCGIMPYRALIESNAGVTQYVGMDLAGTSLYGHVEPELTWDGIKIPLDDASVDCVLATEFLEHHSRPTEVLKEIRRVMKPGGIFFATVPFVWNLHEIPHDEYRYTPYSLERHVVEAGFTNVDVRALGGWDLSLAQMLALWASFSEMSDRRRRMAKKIAFPFYRWLIRRDKTPKGFDGGANSMFPGLSVRAAR